MGNPKQKWTAAEEDALRVGVKKHGTGKWKNIQNDPEFNPLLYSRSNIDLKGRLQLDPFLSELTSMFEHTTEKGSVWVTLKHSSDKSKVQRNKITSAGVELEYKCLVRATDGKKNISTLVGTKDHQRFQASYATILKARMTSLKKREKKDKRKAMDIDKKLEVPKKRPTPKS